jgi:hypothetical protein
MSLAIDNSGNYIICDQGDEDLVPPAGPGRVFPALWRFSPTGDPDFSQNPVSALRALHQGDPLVTPTGVVAESTGAYVVVEPGRKSPPPNTEVPVSGIYRFSPPDYSPPATIIDRATSPPLPAVFPVDMVCPADGHFVVLDRGARLPKAAAPQIIVVRERPTEQPPLTVDIFPLRNISEPTSIAVNGDGNFLVTDAGLIFSTPTEPSGVMLQADIHLVDISTTPVGETSLLGGLPASQNPLIYPTALVLEDPDHLLVSDLGVKPPGRHARLAEPSSLYRITLQPAPPKVDLLSRGGHFVWPSDLALDGRGSLILIDHGESQDQQPARSWRTLPHEFGVIVYFSEARPVVDLGKKQEILGSVTRIVNAEKPAHSHWTLKTNL